MWCEKHVLLFCLYKPGFFFPFFNLFLFALSFLHSLVLYLPVWTMQEQHSFCFGCCIKWLSIVSAALHVLGVAWIILEDMWRWNEALEVSAPLLKCSFLLESECMTRVVRKSCATEWLHGRMRKKGITLRNCKLAHVVAVSEDRRAGTSVLVRNSRLFCG